MATRGEIRDAFYDRLTTDVAGTYTIEDAAGNQIDTVTLDTDDVALYQIEGQENLPQVVYDESYVKINYNGVGAGPDHVDYDNSGNVDAEHWREYIEAQFAINVRAQYEAAKEPIYETLRGSLGELQYAPWPYKNLHDDVVSVEVRDATSADAGNTEDVIRGDQVDVYITFHRDFVFNTNNITQVNLSGVKNTSFTTT